MRMLALLVVGFVAIIGCTAPKSTLGPPDQSADAGGPRSSPTGAPTNSPALSIQDITARLRANDVDIDRTITLTVDGITVFGVPQAVYTIRADDVEIQVFAFETLTAAERAHDLTEDIFVRSRAKIPTTTAFIRVGHVLVSIPDSEDPKAARIVAALQ